MSRVNPSTRKKLPRATLQAIRQKAARKAAKKPERIEQLRKAGKARASSLTPSERTSIARKAARTRWPHPKRTAAA